MFKSYKIEGGEPTSESKRGASRRPKTGKHQSAGPSSFDVVRTLAFKDHFNTIKGNEYVKHNYRASAADAIPYP